MKKYFVIIYWLLFCLLIFSFSTCSSQKLKIQEAQSQNVEFLLQQAKQLWQQRSDTNSVRKANYILGLANNVERNNKGRGKTLEPQLSDLAESGAIEQVAENVFFSYYDYKVTGEKGKKGKNIITLIASKIRYGDSGSVDLGYDGNKCKLYNTMEEIINNEEPLPFS